MKKEAKKQLRNKNTSKVKMQNQYGAWNEHTRCGKFKSKNAENTRKKRTEKTQNHVSQPVGTNTNTPVPVVVKFGLDITRIPLRTDGRWKAYL